MPNREWFIYLEDYDTNKYCIIGPINAQNQSHWFDMIEAQQETGRNIKTQEIQHSQLKEVPSYASARGLREAQPSELIQSPRQRIAEYKGALPRYAQRANRSKLVQMLCKGRCRKTRWAELNREYPGEDELKRASLREFRAKCLYCGHEQTDNYNWYRP